MNLRLDDAKDLDALEERLGVAIAEGERVRRVLVEHSSDLPRFEHLNHWIALIAQESRLSDVA